MSFLKCLWEWVLWLCVLSCCLGCCLGFLQSYQSANLRPTIALLISLLQMHFWESMNDNSSVWAPAIHTRTQMEFLALAMACPIPGCCRHVRRKPQSSWF